MMGTENTSWIVQVHAALERKEADDASSDAPSQLLICKVPSSLRINAEQYEPVHWRFGLHHCHQSLQFDDAEGFKVEVARALQLTGDRWESFCKRVVLKPKKYWEAVYWQSPHANSYTIEEIRCRLSLDALFLVVFLLLLRAQSFNPALQKVMRNPARTMLMYTVYEDFSLVENQIPVELLGRVISILVTECKDNVGEMQEWESEAWQGRNIVQCVEWDYFHDPLIDATEKSEIFERRTNNRLQHIDLYRGVHIFDSIYRMLCGWESLRTTHQKPYLQRYSATHLEACGATIKGKEFTCFEDISFEEGCLSVPFLQVYDTTEKFLRNLVVHESLTISNGRLQNGARCYTYFMGGLIKTVEDVLLLEKQGVLLVEVGSHGMVVDMWKCINFSIPKPLVTDNFYTMMADVNSYTKQRRNKYGFEFKKQFCSRPWIPLSYLAATIVTIATLIQTYVAVTCSNGMKPHFAPQH